MGAITSVVIPVTTIMSCGATTPTNTKIKKPTKETNPLIFTGLSGYATFVMPTLKGTTVSADKTNDLSNGDSVVVNLYIECRIDMIWW